MYRRSVSHLERDQKERFIPPRLLLSREPLVRGPLPVHLPFPDDQDDHNVTAYNESQVLCSLYKVMVVVCPPLSHGSVQTLGWVTRFCWCT